MIEENEKKSQALSSFALAAFALTALLFLFISNPKPEQVYALLQEEAVENIRQQMSQNALIGLVESELARQVTPDRMRAFFDVQRVDAVFASIFVVEPTELGKFSLQLTKKSTDAVLLCGLAAKVFPCPSFIADAYKKRLKTSRGGSTASTETVITVDKPNSADLSNEAVQADANQNHSAPISIGGAAVTADLTKIIADSPSFGASFDCAKATRPQEVLICASPEVSRLDSAMAASYKTLLQRLTVESQNDVRRSQRQWLVFWPIACREDGKSLNPKSKDAQNCAVALYKDRIALFEGPGFVAGDIPLYPVSSYVIRPSDAGVEWVKYAKNVTNFIAVDLAYAPHEKKNLAILIDRWLRKDIAMYSDDGGASSDSTTVRSLIKSLPMLLSTVTTQDFYGHGAAHPLNGYSTQHFYLPKARPMLAADVFQGNQWQDGLTDLVENQLKKELGDFHLISSREDLKKLVSDTAHWNFDRNELTIAFNPYEVAGYAAGAPSVSLQWRDIKTWLTPQITQSVSLK
jgi:uncharacterized protein YecT (DUF1311 family)